jgi:hypothetical protein
MLAEAAAGQAPVDSVSVLSSRDSSTVVLDSLAAHRVPFFSGIEIYIDYGKLLTLPSEFESKMEGGLSVRFFNRFLFALEYGMAVLDPLKAYENAVYYTVEGQYYRLGLDYHIPVDKKNFLYMGARYGISNFEDRGLLNIVNGVWEDYALEFGDAGMTASWYELILGSETQLTIGKEEGAIFIQRLYLGWTFRFRIQGAFENREQPRVYTIPGYGRTFDKTIPALNLYLKYRFGK